MCVLYKSSFVIENCFCVTKVYIDANFVNIESKILLRMDGLYSFKPSSSGPMTARISSLTALSLSSSVSYSALIFPHSLLSKNIPPQL